ncbi:pyridoxamine 5'-phosphate oxidase family protein [Amycolatopsis aidingensis]|uniref:pyridoxamine 5'-phosphate oxidase family protein n=1 Tax=Amycolatopsis aidingensis TaxID=2842453 RepID=UPI001E4C3DFA|nr:pyridoxamine 5'-phosphate oxidase family protein [Amycolatopsis aidingensis]
MSTEELRTVAPAFTEMANRMVYCTMATVDRAGRPRSRMVHALWEWDGTELTGWVGSMVTPLKRAHLAGNPYVSCNYWDGAEAYDTCVAECRAELLLDEASKRECWERFRSTPEPLGYDPGAIGIPEWTEQGPAAPAWGAIRLTPWFLRVFPGEFAKSGGKTGRILSWREPDGRTAR